MKSVSAVILAIFFFSQITFAELNCASVGTASCRTTDGFCFEFIESESADTETFETVCSSSEGEFNTGTCGSQFEGVTCLVESNPIFPIMRFEKDLEEEVSTQLCSGLNGKLCPVKK